jgi:ABC-type sugar transport system permease subunit
MREPVLVSADREVAALPAPAGESRVRRFLVGYGLLTPAVVAAIVFSFIPLGYIILVSFTRESTFFLHHPEYTADNYREIWDRYMPHVYTTVRLAILSSLFDLVFGFPFAYILVRKISYRGLVRTLMVFPLFGPLYLAFGLYYVLLPNGPLYPVLEFLGIKPTTLL